MSEPERILTLIVLIGAALAALVGIWRALRGASRFFEKTNRFFEDWYGSPAEDGHIAKKGVLHRLDDLERDRAHNTGTLSRLETKMDEVVHEVTNNDGSSVKDAVHRIELQQQEEVLERKSFSDKYDRDQRILQAERRALHERISQMIGADPIEQERIWDELGDKWASGNLAHEDPDSTL